MTGGVALTRLDSARHGRTLWKNGGGVTVDIAGAFAAGAAPGAWDGTIWRLGRTRIERPGPFSDLSGFDRLLAVVGGRGLVLRPAAAPVLDVRTAFRPVRFPGEWHIESELEDGPVAVVNLMADRRHAAIDLRFAAGAAVLAFEPGTLVLYAAAGAATVEVVGRSIALAADDALQVESDAPLSIALHSGIIAAASIRPCSSLPWGRPLPSPP